MHLTIYAETSQFIFLRQVLSLPALIFALELLRQWLNTISMI